MEPRLALSVVIPFYSRENDLTPTIQALEKSYSKLCPKEKWRVEVIIINDCSPVAPAGSSLLPLRQIDLPENRVPPGGLRELTVGC